MSNRLLYYPAIFFLVAGSSGSMAQSNAELSTLFTTPQERQIINSNRYKAERKQVKKQESTDTDAVAVRELVKETVTQSYKVSGISINMDGSNMAWVNSKAYENGATLDDGSRIRINNSKIKSISIITPDGKQHTATSGETLTVSYIRSLEE